MTEICPPKLSSLNAIWYLRDTIAGDTIFCGKCWNIQIVAELFIMVTTSGRHSSPALYTSRTYGTPSSACPNNPSIHRHRHLSCSSWWGQDFVVLVVVLGLVHWVRWLVVCTLWQRYCGYNRRRQLMTSVIRLWDKSHEDDLAKTNFRRMDRQRERPRESDRQDEDLFDIKPATICLCHLHVDPIHYSGCSVSRCVSLGRCWGEDVEVDRGVVGWVGGSGDEKGFVHRMFLLTGRGHTPRGWRGHCSGWWWWWCGKSHGEDEQTTHNPSLGHTLLCCIFMICFCFAVCNGKNCHLVAFVANSLWFIIALSHGDTFYRCYYYYCYFYYM